MRLSYLSVTRALGRLAASIPDEDRGPVRRRELGLSKPEQEPDPCAPFPSGGLGCWLVRVTLALFLLPALLVVLLVGAVGILVLDVAQVCTRWSRPAAR